MTGLIMMIAIAAITGYIGLAKRGRGSRKMGRYIRGNIDLDFALGTLAAQDVVVSAVAGVVAERTLVSSIVATYAMQGYTVTDNVGPVVVGVAHSDYSDAEIEAWIEQQTGSWSEADLPAREVASRKIRRIGSFSPPLSIASTALNDGKPMKTKLNWILNVGQNLKFWAYNQGSVAIGTTDPDVHVTGHANLWPR